MTSTTLWFTTKNNSVLHHALTGDDRATCNKRIRPHLFPIRNTNGETIGHGHNGQTSSKLPEYAQMCPRCLATVGAAEYADRDKFSDWDNTGTELELTDQGDSISFTTRLVGHAATLEAEVRIKPEDLDRLERRIAAIRAARRI